MIGKRQWHNHGMTKARLSTTVDADLLKEARALHPGGTDAALVEAALRALLQTYRAAEIDATYAEAYTRWPANTDDDWGDVANFLDEARRS